MTNAPFSPSDYLLDSSREYSIYICQERAIPSVTDGLKSGQRVALWMLRNRSDKIKTYALSGELAAAKIYVHGNASSDAAISLLCAPFRNNIPLVAGTGQFGSRVAPDKVGIGASRYTSVSKSKAAQAFVYNDLDLIELTDNYDGSNKQPVTFLPLIPVVLLNGCSGIASGWSCDLLPHDFKDLVAATKAALLGKDIPTLVPHYAKYNLKVVKTAKPNQWELIGKVEIVDTSTARVTELPYDLRIEDFRKHLIDLEDKDLISGFVDRSTDCIDITVKFKRGAIKDWTEQQLIDLLKLTQKVTERIVVIDWCGTRIKQYDSPEALVKDFAEWRLGFYSKRFAKLLADTSYELNYWRALAILFQKGFTKKLGKFPDKASMQSEIVSLLSPKLSLDDSQLERILNLQTYRWTTQFEAEVGKKIEELSAAIKSYDETLASPDKLKAVYLSELDNLKNFKES